MSLLINVMHPPLLKLFFFFLSYWSQTFKSYCGHCQVYVYTYKLNWQSFVLPIFQYEVVFLTSLSNINLSWFLLPFIIWRGHWVCLLFKWTPYWWALFDYAWLCLSSVPYHSSLFCLIHIIALEFVYPVLCHSLLTVSCAVSSQSPPSLSPSVCVCGQKSFLTCGCTLLHVL